MPDRNLSRRRLIATAGATAIFGLAGCSSSGDQETDASTTSASGEETTTAPESTETETATATTTSSDASTSSNELRGPRQSDTLPKDTKPLDGYPPEFETTPEERQINPDEFETLSRSGFEIKLVPTDVAYYWYARQEARFADARSESEFDVSHVFGAVLSPAGDGRVMPDDPVLEWPKDQRIITYCDCPHHLSSLRAASLKNKGYEKVYALDEGFSAWREQNFPLAGNDVGRVPETRVIEGEVPGTTGDETAWAYHVNSNQREATQIRNGQYELELKFVNVTDSSKIRIETPAYTLTDTLGRLTSGRITENGNVVGADTTSNGSTNTTSNTTTTNTTTSNATETFSNSEGTGF